MVATVIADTGFLVALLVGADSHHEWAVAQAERHATPWHTCEPVITEGFHLLGPRFGGRLGALVQRQAVVVSLDLAENIDAVLGLMQKYSDRPMSLADACVVRMSEILREPVVLTTDSDFRVYRRHGRQVVPCVMPR